MRLDAFLTARGDFDSRAAAQAAIRARKVRVGGRVVVKASFDVSQADRVVCDGPAHPWVSRGGLKLEAALARFAIDPAGCVCLDLGASTGGFTDVLRARGAARVYAVDVGRGQLHPRLRDDPRVTALEGTHAKDLSAALIPQPLDLIVCDVSFISLTKALPPALALAAPGARLVALVKPQFELGPDRIGKNGRVTGDPEYARGSTGAPDGGVSARRKARSKAATAPASSCLRLGVSLDVAAREHHIRPGKRAKLGLRRPMPRTPVETAALRAGYAVTQTARATWYAAHYAALRRIAEPQRRTEPASDTGRLEDGALIRALIELYRADWRNIEAGVYPPPHDMAPRPGALSRLLGRSRRFFRDAPVTARRKAEHGHSEVLTEARRKRYPRYYLQNFHYQTDGWLSRDSARLYDTQVETLFSGAADAMRRQGLTPIHAYMQGRDPRDVRLVDIACGTGRFLSFLKQAFPAMPVTALDLSPDYLEEARRLLADRRDVDFVHANAETMPFEDASLDIAVSVFLFHELPPKVRRAVAAEIARVLKPGGIFVLVDSIQLGDREGFDVLVENFPVEFHEPYYMSYAKEDLEALFGDAGLAPLSLEMAFLSRVASYRKPAAH